VLRSRGTIATYANDGGKPVELNVGQNMVLNTRFQFLVLYTAGPEDASRGRRGRRPPRSATGALHSRSEGHGLPLARFRSTARPTPTRTGGGERHGSARSWWSISRRGRSSRSVTSG